MAVKQVHECLLDGRQVAIFERSITFPNPALNMIPTTTVVETFYVCEAPDLPVVRIRTRRGLMPLLYRLGRRPGLELDDPRFNAAFRVDTEDEDFAIILLSPEMQSFLLEKRSVDWSTGPEGLKLFYRGGLKKKRLEASLDRMRRFWALVPPELLDWFA